MSDSLNRGHVLVMSLWDDASGQMLWLDSTVPAGSTAPGAKRGPCSTDSGKAEDLEKNHKDAFVRFSNIRVGEIGSTTPSDAIEFLQ